MLACPPRIQSESRDAGNLHVRFDEREVETEHGLRLFGTGDAKGPANGKSLA
jgi:hypothetical protein